MTSAKDRERYKGWYERAKKKPGFAASRAEHFRKWYKKAKADKEYAALLAKRAARQRAAHPERSRDWKRMARANLGDNYIRAALHLSGLTWSKHTRELIDAKRDQLALYRAIQCAKRVIAAEEPND